MAAENKLTYDEKMARVEAIVTQLEQADAISMDAYKKLAAEATSLLSECKSDVEGLAKDLMH